MMSLTRFLRILVMLSLVLAPVVTMTAPPAMARAAAASASHHDRQTSASHCADMADDQSGQHQGAGSFDNDCRMKCAMSCSAVTLLDNVAMEPFIAAGEVRPRWLLARLTGLAPEAADPPPRTA